MHDSNTRVMNSAMVLEETEGGMLNGLVLGENELSIPSTDQDGKVGSSSNPRSLIEDDQDGVQVSCFSEDVRDFTLHFHIIRLQKQIYTWIGCNSAKFGHLYAAAFTRPNNSVSITSILGGASDNTGSSIARRLVMKTGLNIILACNIPKNSPMLEADAERILVQKLVSLGYTRTKISQMAPII